MRFWAMFLSVAALLVLTGASLAAQTGEVESGSSSLNQQLRQAKLRAQTAQHRAELLRQEASNAQEAVDQAIARRAQLSAEIEAATADMAAARARMAIIAREQKVQRAELGRRSEPILRLNTALQQLTRRPAILMAMQPGKRRDYVHLRAVMGHVQPEILRRTADLRGQLARQRRLHDQEMAAVRSLDRAAANLAGQKRDLARLEKENRGRATSLLANAAVEFERSIAEGERARDIVENIEYRQQNDRSAANLTALDGPPLLAEGRALVPANGRTPYLLPKHSRIMLGIQELNDTGYRERGIMLRLPENAEIPAPASGKISFAGPYRSYGNIVMIDHGGGWITLITHLGRLNVGRSATVRQGQVIAVLPDGAGEIGMELRRHGRVMDIVALLY